MEKLVLKKIYRSTKDKQGNILKTKDGREYERLAFQCDNYGTAWVSGFSNKENALWKQGDSVEVEIEKSGQWLNFKMPPKTVNRQEFESLADRVQLLENRVYKLKPEEYADDIPSDEPEPEIPF